MPIEYPSAAGTRVLVVDDDYAIRAVIRDALEVAGCEVTVAGNGLEALEAARSSPPDVIVLDVLMPVMSGVEFLAAYHEEFAAAVAPVIMMTALSGASRAGLPRPAAFLRKPFDLDALVEVVASVTDASAPEGAPESAALRPEQAASRDRNADGLAVRALMSRRGGLPA